MKNIRVVFMGTPVFACSILQTLIDHDYDVVGVVSQPDKKVGRKQILTPTPVKELAEKYHIPVFQPTKISKDYDQVLAWKPDLIVTCAYGQMIPVSLLEAPTYGSLNVHASLLPKLRGGAPIHKAIIYGEKETGVSIMRMVKQMDAGAYMLQEKVKISDEDTAGSLHDKLMEAGSKAIIEAIPLLVSGKAKFIEQDEQEATFAYNITKDEERIDFTKDYYDVYNQIRGLIPWPVANMEYNGNIYKIHGIKLTKLKTQLKPGTLFIRDKKLYLACLNGVLEITEIQKAGKKKMSAQDFISGNRGDLIED